MNILLTIINNADSIFSSVFWGVSLFGIMTIVITLVLSESTVEKKRLAWAIFAAFLLILFYYIIIRAILIDSPRFIPIPHKAKDSTFEALVELYFPQKYISWNYVAALYLYGLVAIFSFISTKDKIAMGGIIGMHVLTIIIYIVYYQQPEPMPLYDMFLLLLLFDGMWLSFALNNIIALLVENQKALHRILMFIFFVVISMPVTSYSIYYSSVISLFNLN